MNVQAPTAAWDGRFKPRLAERWPEFVNCPKRLESEGPFLLNLLRQKSSRIFDAAVGTGCETVFLAKHGFDVTGNEIDTDLMRHAKDLAEQEAAHVHFTNYDWLDLEQRFESASFDVTFVMGNSLCLLRDEESRREAARNFRAICKAGGAVVVDERNFDYILREREKILKGNFRYTGRVMYCGKSIRGRPDIIEDEHVRFVYEDVKSGHALGYLDMHPFQRGELPKLFMKAGFPGVEVFSDFEPGYRESADFFTYVFR